MKGLFLVGVVALWLILASDNTATTTAFFTPDLLPPL